MPPDITPRHPARHLTHEERHELERRALVAWHQSRAGEAPAGTTRPVEARVATKTKNDPATGEIALLHFVALYAGGDILAVYRVRPVKDYFMLRRLVRWPKDLIRLKGSPGHPVGNDTGNEEL